MALTAGTRLGSYAIIKPLGAGGMGEVYRARDTRLDRDVAIKVLPASFGDDPQALARFEREAKSVANLSHPNILAIFDFGRTDCADGGRPGVTYAVMELLEGETLRERLATAPLPPRKAIEYAVQVARGLAAAHDRGFVHRDLKPENLFVTLDDRVKILDFGLAKPLDLGTSAATMADAAPTAVGTVMGTIGYMAPEQLRGHAVDHRSDIFAFGAVLHEMLTGRRAFHGESPADTISAILNREPVDLDADRVTVPPALERIVRRCLEKKPELRFQSAHDLAFALETLSASTPGAAAVAPQERTTVRAHPRLPWAIAAGAVIAAAAAIAFAVRGRPREVPWQTFTAITDAAGIETAPSLSPDGTTVAYATQAQGTWDIYVQRVGGRRALPVAAEVERDEQAPAFSPDGSLIAYHDRGTSGGIFVAGATGESSRRLTDFGFHPAWSPDGRRIAFCTEEIANPYSRLGGSTLWIIEVSGGVPQEVKGTGDAVQPSWSPSGARIAYWSNTAGQRDIYTVPATGGARVAVTDDAPLDWDPAWSADGRHVYFASDRGGSMNLWRVAIDDRSGSPEGAAQPVTTGVQASSEMPAFSGDGARLAFRSTVLAINPVSIPFDPISLRAGTATVLSNSNSVRFPSDVSPDGRSLALANLGEPQEDLFIGATDGTAVRRLTDDPARDRVPVFARDGKSLFFYSQPRRRLPDLVGRHRWRRAAEGGPGA